MLAESNHFLTHTRNTSPLAAHSYRQTHRCRRTGWLGQKVECQFSREPISLSGGQGLRARHVTQLQLLQFWLQAEDHQVVITEWTPSKLIRRTLKAARKQGQLFSRHTEVLYHRPHFGAALQQRQVGIVDTGSSITNEQVSAEGCSKVKKAKGKK